MCVSDRCLLDEQKLRPPFCPSQCCILLLSPLSEPKLLCSNCCVQIPELPHCAADLSTTATSFASFLSFHPSLPRLYLKPLLC